MNDNLKMFFRYGVAVGVSYAVAKGWITPTAGEQFTQSIVELGGILVAFIPAIYAAMKVSNQPKT